MLQTRAPAELYLKPKELELIVRINYSYLSVDKALNIAKTITTLNIKFLTSGETLTKTILITTKLKSISKLFEQKFWGNF